MKFWVKAIVDDSLQEQLFVSASSTEELRAELEDLLHIDIATISIQDFHVQVVDKLDAGEDIITVRVKKPKPVSRRSSGAELSSARLGDSRPSAPSGGLENGYSTAEAAASRDPAPVTRSRLSISSPALTPPAAEPARLGDLARLADRSDSHERGNTSFGSGVLSRLGVGNAGVTPDAEPLSANSVSPSRSPSFMEFPAVGRLWVSREDVGTLLAKSFKGKYRSVLAGCFVRTMGPGGYDFLQIQAVDKSGAGSLILDTVYGTELVRLEAISNAEPAADELRRWMRKMLGSGRAFPTHGFVEAKLSDLQSAVEAARAALAGSPPPPPPLATTGNDGGPFDLGSGAPSPPSPVASEGEERVPGQRLRRPTVRSQLLQAPVGAGGSGGRVSFKVNDELEWVSVQLEDGGVGVGRLAVYGTRHSNAAAPRPRRSDYAGCRILLDPAPSPAASAPLGVATHDRDTTEKGLAVFGAPVQWRGRYMCLGQRRPIRSASSFSPYVAREGTDGEGESSEDGSAAPRLVQDFVLLAGATPDALACAAAVTSLPVPVWALREGREVVLQQPTLVEHRGALHCFYLVRLDSTSSVGLRGQSTPLPGRRHSMGGNGHERRLSAGPAVNLSRRSSGLGSEVLALGSSSGLHRDANGGAGPGDSVEGLGAAPAGDLPPGGAVADSPTTSNGPPSYAYGLAHAVAVTAIGDGSDGDGSGSGDLAAEAAAGDLPDRLRWRLVSARAPLMESVGERPPLFAVASVDAEAELPSRTPSFARGAPRGVYTGGTSSAPDSPTDGTSTDVRTVKELNLLWHPREQGSPSLSMQTPPGASPLPLAAGAPGAFGGRAVVRLSPARPRESLCGAHTLSPAASRRRSPAVASLQPDQSLSGRSEIPFRRVVNTDPACGPTGWVEDAYFAAVEIDAGKLRAEADSLSLLTRGDRVWLATVGGSGGRLTVWTIPISGEP